MGGFKDTEARRASDLVASWDRFIDREHGFLPPKLAGFWLGMTPQGLYSAADRGRLRFHLVGVCRFYSAADVFREFESRVSRARNEAVPPWERHLPLDPSQTAPLASIPEAVGDWLQFLRDHGGAYPSRVAAARLKITGQGVWLAHRAGWIRSFRVGRENFFSRRDVRNYWFSGSRRNGDRFPRPAFVGRNVVGGC